MASFQHPFQCLQYVKRQSESLSDLLIASAGRQLYSYDAANGQRLDIWPQHVESETASATSTSEGQAPPEKRRKLSPASEDQKSEQPSSNTPTWSNIPILVTSADGKYVIALTAEDKAIRVLQLSKDGKFQELSSRYVGLHLIRGLAEAHAQVEQCPSGRVPSP